MANFHRALRSWGGHTMMGGQNWHQGLGSLMHGLGYEMQQSYYARQQTQQVVQQMQMMANEPMAVAALANQLETMPGTSIGVTLIAEQIKQNAANPAIVQQLVTQLAAASASGYSTLGMGQQLMGLSPYMGQFQQNYWGQQGQMGGYGMAGGHHHR